MVSSGRARGLPVCLSFALTATPTIVYLAFFVCFDGTANARARETTLTELAVLMNESWAIEKLQTVLLLGGT